MIMKTRRHLSSLAADLRRLAPGDLTIATTSLSCTNLNHTVQS